MIFKRDNFLFGAILGFIGPIIGIVIFKLVKFQSFSWGNVLKYMYLEQGHRTFSVALSLALMINAVLFTIYINTRRDHTAKGIFVLTLIYGLIVLSIKTFS